MKRIVLGMVLVLLVVLFISCGSLSGSGYNPESSVPNSEAIDQISTNFRGDRRTAGRDAHAALLEAAKQTYHGNIDIVNISWSPVAVVIYTGRGTFRATGTVVRINEARAAETAIEAALERAAEEISETFSPRTRIAIVYKLHLKAVLRILLQEILNIICEGEVL